MSDYKVKAWSWCADYCKKNHWNPHDSYFWDKAMLEYRRENNIFDIGDAIVISSRGNGIFHFNALFSDSDIAEARHATTAEIQAGRRL